MKNIGIIPCDNGLGHTTRSISLANLLSKTFKVTLYLKKIKNLNINKKISVKKINSNFKLLDETQYDTNWYKKINKLDLKKIDLLISDNLPEAILLNKKIILFANFFWHEIFNLKKKFFRDLEKKIYKNKIKIISNYMFGNINPSKVNIFKIGFTGSFFDQNKSKAKGILISLGTSKIGYKTKLNSLLKLFKNHNFKNYQFYLDKNLIRNKTTYPKNVKIANFSNEMFKDIRIALIKPGFSTIQDCLRRGIPITSYLQKDNKEFLNNANVLKRNKIGNYFYNFDEALKETVTRFDNKKDIIKTKNLCKKLRWKGEKDLQKQIEKVINVETTHLYSN